MARWTVEAATNMDVAAEARGRPRVKIRPDGADFAAAELAPVENRPGGDAEEEGADGAAGMEGAEFIGLAQEADDEEVDDVWARHRQQPKYPVRHEDVPSVAMCDGVRGAAQVQPYKNAFLAGYAAVSYTHLTLPTTRYV